METLLVGDAPCVYQRVIKVMKKSSCFVRLMDNWQFLARDLDVREEVIKKLKNDMSLDKLTFGDLLHDLLSIWRAQAGESATLGKLCEGLEKNDMNDISQTLKREFLKTLKEEFVTDGLLRLQGIRTTISKIDTGSDGEITRKLLSHVTDEMLVQMKQKEPICLLNNTLPKTPLYYIRRNVSVKTCLNPEIFQIENKADIFVIIGLEWNELSNLAKGNSTDVSSNQTREVTVRFILLEDEADFELIGSHTNDPVHLLSHKDGHFLWVKSYRGNFGILQKFIHQEQKSFTELEFSHEHLNIFSSKPVCVGDTPGMGKSVLLANLAKQIKLQNLPNRIVLFFELGELTKEASIANETSSVLSMIADICVNDNFGREVLLHLLLTKTILVELFLDGFDEVLPSQLEGTQNLLAVLKGLENVRIFVTTRPHMMDVLENTLGVLGYNILPFSEENQIEFLCKYWTSECGATESTILTTFSKKCLTSLKEDMTDAERDIAGVPLQCSLLAEVYAPDAVRYSKGKTKFEFFRIASLFDMYHKLFHFKLRKVEEEHDRLKNSEGKLKRFWRFLTSEKYPKEKVLNSHVHEAINLIFPEWGQRFSKRIQYHQDVTSEIFAVGVMEKNNALLRPRFVHRTFAEFLIADFLATGINDNKNCVELVFNTVLGAFLETSQGVLGIQDKVLRNFEFHYRVIAYFFNGHLDKQNLDYKKIAGLIPKTVLCKAEEILLACSVNNFNNCFLLVQETLFSCEGSPKIEKFLPSLLLSATKYSKSIATVKQCIDFSEKYNSRGFESIKFPTSPQIRCEVTPLHIAVQIGSYQLTEYFLNLYERQDIKYLVHLCVNQTVLSSPEIINQKQEIIKLILRKFPSKIEEKLPIQKSTALLQAHIHFDLLALLLDKNADVNATDANGNNFFHFVFRKLQGKKVVTPALYTKLFNIFVSINFDQINSKNSDGRTMLHVAVEFIEPEDVMLDKCNELCADFNTCDRYGDSLLFVAIRHGRSKEFIEKLANKFNCKYNHKNYFGQTALHIASKYGNYKVLSHLILAYSYSVHEVDKYGNTPLHLSMLHKSKIFKKVQQLLIDQNASCTKPNSAGCIPLIQALKNGFGLSYEIFLKMKSKGLQMNKTLASEAMTFLIQNKKIRAIGGGDSDFAKLFLLLYTHGGVIQFRIGEPERSLKEKKALLIKQIIDDLAKATIVNHKFLTCFNEYTKSIARQDVSKFYEHVVAKQVQPEKVMLALLETNQQRAFYLMRHVFQLENAKATNYVTSPKSVDTFLDSTDNFLVLKTLDLDICSERLLNTIPGAVEFKLNTNIPPNTAVCIVKIDNLMMDHIQSLESEEAQKIIIITNSVSSDIEVRYDVAEDSLERSDLSPEFQKQLQQKFVTEDFLLREESKLIFLEILRENDLVSLIKSKDFWRGSFKKIVDKYLLTLETEGMYISTVFNDSPYEAGAVKSEDSKNGEIRLRREDRNIHEVLKWYGLAKRLIEGSRHPNEITISGLDFESAFLKFVRTEEYKQNFCFKNELLVYFLDELLENVSDFRIPANLLFVSLKQYARACAFHKAFNLLHNILVHNYMSNPITLPNNVVHLMVTDTMHLSPNKIQICLKCLLRLVKISEVFFTQSNPHGQTPLSMPSIHHDLHKCLTELQWVCS